MNSGYGGPTRQGIPDKIKFNDANSNSPDNSNDYYHFTISILIVMLGVQIWWFFCTDYLVRWMMITESIIAGIIFLCSDKKPRGDHAIAEILFKAAWLLFIASLIIFSILRF